MSQPTPYTPNADFSQQEANNASGRSTVNTAALDAEFAAIETTLDQTLANLQLIQRDDGQLKDTIVSVMALDQSVINLMGGWTLKGAWLTVTDYAVNDLVSSGEYTYVCLTAHQSGIEFDSQYWSRFGFAGSADAAIAAAQASASAASAATSATTATTKAASSTASASSAATSSGNAAAHASTATTKAGEAAASATNAANSAAKLPNLTAAGANKVVISNDLGSAWEYKTYQDLVDEVDISARGAEQIGFLPSGTGAVVSDVQTKLREKVSVSDFGGDVQLALNTTSTHINNGTHSTVGLTVAANSVVTSDPRALIYHTVNSNPGINGSTGDNITIKDVSVDMGYSRGLTAASHGFRFQGNNITLDSVKASDFAYNGAAGGGTGAAFFPDTGLRLSGLRIKDSDFVANSSGSEAFGWIYVDTDTSFVTNTYVYGAVGNAVGTGYAHELKNNCRHNYLGGLIANYANVALAFGQDTVGDDGSDRNVIVGVVGKAVDIGYLNSEGDENLLVGMLYDPDSSPNLVTKYAVQLGSDTSSNASYAVYSRGSPTSGAKIAGTRNFTQLAAMHAVGSEIARFDSGATKNVIDISHPGGRSTLVGFIADSSGASRRSSNANVAYSLATGEQLGSQSGTFYRSLSTVAASWNTNHYFRDEGDTYAIHAYGTDAASGSIAGIQHSVTGDSDRAGFWHQNGATIADDFWSVRGWGAGGRFGFYKDDFRPGVDNTISVGTALRRWSVVYAGTGAINTSDERAKQDISTLDAAEKRVAVALKGLIKKFRFRGAVEAKGEDARIHVGVIAQDVVKAFADEGLDATRYGVLCFDEWDDICDEDGAVVTVAGNRYGVRYDELFSFVVAAL